MMLLLLLLLQLVFLSLPSPTCSFVPSGTTTFATRNIYSKTCNAAAASSQTFTRTTSLAASAATDAETGGSINFDDLDDIGFPVSVPKPLGVIFEENYEPYKGLVISDVEPGLNGGKAGMRMGDNLMVINGEPVIGKSFEYVMGKLIDSEGTLELQFFRGPVRNLYDILQNRNIAVQEDQVEDEDDEDEDEDIVMDEDYESPVTVDPDDYADLTIGDVVGVIGDIGADFVGGLFKKQEPGEEVEEEEEDDDDDTPSPPPPEKKGFFGGLFKQETVQLDEKDARGY
mmetsp:Transcript_35244/g.54107  ORF Transcript_35244/g.54107 Transcript_35244/m.54107 type:complete len:285 (-) Transcript_35244:174-1028(-)